MEQKQLEKNRSSVGWSWKHLVGFVLCVILTAFSLSGYLYASYEPKVLLLVITALAFVQAVIQLFRIQPEEQ
ncbi:hypothetical protein LCM20_01220 [Halobacillus litoralis]|uniref:hypothetical protein n=1 Tax=Halobacillus litoralis TaxID=45668 RepID=UPI001CD43EE9|nr:hypothetical protein [Halobacillus litoralis]MCA0969205.1 hypothetical protein [Halobacillus litoralis]